MNGPESPQVHEVYNTQTKENPRRQWCADACMDRVRNAPRRRGNCPHQVGRCRASAEHCTKYHSCFRPVRSPRHSMARRHKNGEVLSGFLSKMPHNTPNYRKCNTLAKAKAGSCYPLKNNEKGASPMPIGIKISLP